MGRVVSPTRNQRISDVVLIVFRVFTDQIKRERADGFRQFDSNSHNPVVAQKEESNGSDARPLAYAGFRDPVD